MISFTAFRSVYVSSQASRARKEPANKAWHSSTVAAIRRKRALNQRDEESIPELPTVPSASLTGMRTLIQGGRRTPIGLQITNSKTIGDMEPEQRLLHESPAKLIGRIPRHFYQGKDRWEGSDPLWAFSALYAPFKYHRLAALREKFRV